MLTTLLAWLAEWRAYRKTYATLRQLDPILLADLGLADIDLSRISRAAARQRGAVVSVYELVDGYFDEDIRKPVKFKVRSTERCAPAETRRYAEVC
ncbi:DUF1127 domain-containing protein [Pelagibacterium halotolerans]|uniref:DUF1127 domain-containing protein n=1 Tax=Pelagibacterium halotolerans TaxID=531813 RepID=UPI003850E10B